MLGTICCKCFPKFKKNNIGWNFFFTHFVYSELKQVIVEKMIIVGIPFPQQQH